jgi:glutamate/tyrosine decarboxylase-like PLP-dependent enzyme
MANGLAKHGSGWTADHERMLMRAAEQAIAFRRALPSRLQRPERDYGAMRALFHAPLPESGTDGMRVIDELVRLSQPGLSAMAGPRFFGWVIGGSHPVGVAADWLTSAWGQNSGSHTPTPSAAACEEVAAAWLLELLDLPPQCSVGFTTGATMANFTCLAAARTKLLQDLGWDVEARGLFGAPELRVLIGEDAHSSAFAALQLLGLGSERVNRIPTDRMGRMKAEEAVRALRSATSPTIVLTQAGQVNTGAIDPIGEIAAGARGTPVWIHVDGAFGLWARACPDTKTFADGIDQADSWACDGHKWLQTPYDCGYAIIRDTQAHRRAMTNTASYLPTAGEGERDPSHLVPELSRRARGFATWAIIHALGRDGIAALIAGNCRLARQMAARLAAEPGIAVENDVILNQVAIRFGADRPTSEGDAATRRVIERVQADGICFAAGARWKGHAIMRLSVSSWATTAEDAERSAAAIIDAWRAVQGRTAS